MVYLRDGCTGRCGRPMTSTSSIHLSSPRRASLPTHCPPQGGSAIIFRAYRPPRKQAAASAGVPKRKPPRTHQASLRWQTHETCFSWAYAGVQVQSHLLPAPAPWTPQPPPHSAVHFYRTKFHTVAKAASSPSPSSEGTHALGRKIKVHAQKK